LRVFELAGEEGEEGSQEFGLEGLEFAEDFGLGSRVGDGFEFDVDDFGGEVFGFAGLSGGEEDGSD